MPGLIGANSRSAAAFCVGGEPFPARAILEIRGGAVSTWRQERYPGDSYRRTGGFEMSAALKKARLVSIFVG